MAGDGVANSRIAARLGISRPTALKWRSRFRSDGLDSVGEVRPGRGRKPEIAALDRTQPGLPTKPGRAGTMNPGCERRDTTTLLAALNALMGRVIGERHGRRRHQEFLKFMRRLDRAFPRDLVLHVILDNHGTHDRDTVRQWLAGRPRFRLHFTPTGASWLNLVESWLGGLTQYLRGGAFCSVQELVAAIEEYSARDEAETEPLVWNTTVDAVLDRVRDRGAALETSR